MTAPSKAAARALDELSACPMSAGVGVDLVDVGMLKELLKSGGSAFLDTGWTEAEQRDVVGSPERLAGRWAVKEAVMKALGRGLGDIDPLHIEVVTVSSGAPEVRLRDSAAAAAQQAGVETVRVSMAHEQGWAVGFAVAAPPRCGRCSAIENQVQDNKGNADDR